MLYAGEALKYKFYHKIRNVQSETGASMDKTRSPVLRINCRVRSMLFLLYIFVVT